MNSSSSRKAECYAAITESVAAALDRGVVAWRKPWALGGEGSPVRLNGEQYAGVNRLHLGVIQEAHGYPSPVWGTYRGWSERGGQVARGEKSSLGIWAGKITRDEGTDAEKSFFTMKSFSLFNEGQQAGAEVHRPAAPAAPVAPTESEKRLAEISEAWTAVGVHHGGDRAYYSQALDAIHLPARESFDSGVDYWRVRLHEQAHATGHESRLNRTFGRFGDGAYSREELVAEVAASLLCQVAGAEQGVSDRSAAYLQGWARALRADPEAIVVCCSAAKRAADLIQA